MKKSIWLFFFLPLFSYAQKGIQFDSSNDWDDIKAKAKSENKFIFVDCYASWCTPCKAMDQDVYNDEKVGRILNEKFISVKCQMDDKEGDSKKLRIENLDAETVLKTYNINSFPTYLFFSPQGIIVHKEKGYKKQEDFITLARNATDTSSQYYLLIDKFNKGSLDYLKMPYLAVTERNVGDDSLAYRIANEYINKYLLFTKPDYIYTKDNIKFITTFLLELNSQYFDIFYLHGSRIDSIMNSKGYARKVVNKIIFNQDIFPFFAPSEIQKHEPNWSKIRRRIKSKYPLLEDYERNVLEGKIAWYNYNAKKYDKCWRSLINCIIERVESYGADSTFIGGPDNYINDISWNYIFLHSMNKKQLDKAIKWMHEVVRRDPKDPFYSDTYANLLYKRGYKEEALAIEESVIKLFPKSKKYQETLSKMKKGEPTWLILKKR